MGPPPTLVAFAHLAAVVVHSVVFHEGDAVVQIQAHGRVEELESNASISAGTLHGTLASSQQATRRIGGKQRERGRAPIEGKCDTRTITARAHSPKRKPPKIVDKSQRS